MAVKDLIVGNLNIVFVGDKCKYDFLDYWDEISKLVFQDDVSSGTAPKFLLKNITINKFGSKKDLAIAGRFVKSTVLSVKQVLEGNELKPRNESHESAPSAVFVYLLENHILLYWGEHPGYPSVKSFKTFLEKCLNKQRRKLIRAHLLATSLTGEEAIDILSKYPEATVEYIPLPLIKNIDEQFDDVEEVKKLFVRQYYQNANIDYRSVMRTNQSLMAAVKSQKIDYSLTKIGDIQGTKELVKEIAEAGDADFKIDAKTRDGKKAITNEGIQYTKHFADASENDDIKRVATKIINAYHSDIENGDIPLIPPKNSAEILEKVKINA